MKQDQMASVWHSGIFLLYVTSADSRQLLLLQSLSNLCTVMSLVILNEQPEITLSQNAGSSLALLK